MAQQVKSPCDPMRTESAYKAFSLTFFPFHLSKKVISRFRNFMIDVKQLIWKVIHWILNQIADICVCPPNIILCKLMVYLRSRLIYEQRELLS